MDHSRYIKRTLQLARRGIGAVSPNPRVGAVIVDRDGKVLSEGWHRKFGSIHAEVDALSRVDVSLTKGASLYVNLEPCAHHNHTPPCTEAIVQAGIRKVFAISRDPDPRVSGRGFAILRDAGVEVELIGNLEQAKELNRGFFTWIEKGRAWCEAKIALSLDGKMADCNGMSKWISGEESRKLAHKLRADLDAVLVGGNTAKVDDPELTVRMVKGNNPVRLILSNHTQLLPISKLAVTADRVRTILLRDRSGELLPNFEELILKSGKDGLLDALQILKALPNKGITSVLIEGGAGVLHLFLKADVIDRITIAYSPSVIGSGISPFEMFKPGSWNERPRYVVKSVRKLGEDVIVRYDRREELFLQD